MQKYAEQNINKRRNVLLQTFLQTKHLKINISKNYITWVFWTRGASWHMTRPIAVLILRQNLNTINISECIKPFLLLIFNNCWGIKLPCSFGFSASTSSFCHSCITSWSQPSTGKWMQCNNHIACTYLKFIMLFIIAMTKK